MAELRLCDSCGKPITKTNPLTAKLFMVPVVEGRVREQFSNYSAHMDIGQCCAPKVTRWRWQKRIPRSRAKVAQNGS